MSSLREQREVRANVLDMVILMERKNSTEDLEERLS